MINCQLRVSSDEVKKKIKDCHESESAFWRNYTLSATAASSHTCNSRSNVRKHNCFLFFSPESLLKEFSSLPSIFLRRKENVLLSSNGKFPTSSLNHIFISRQHRRAMVLPKFKTSTWQLRRWDEKFNWFPLQNWFARPRRKTCTKFSVKSSIELCALIHKRDIVWAFQSTGSPAQRRVDYIHNSSQRVTTSKWNTANRTRSRDRFKRKIDNSSKYLEEHIKAFPRQSSCLQFFFHNNREKLFFTVLKSHQYTF